jgi:hypothetical protein
MLTLANRERQDSYIQITTLCAVLGLALGCTYQDRDENVGGGVNGSQPGGDGGGAPGDDGADDGGDPGDDGGDDGGDTGDDGGDDGGDPGDDGGDPIPDVGEEDDPGGDPPGECPPSGKPAPTGCWQELNDDWYDYYCGCGPAISQTGGPANPVDTSSCSAFAHPGELLDEINSIRDGYVNSGPTLCHERYKGIPWQGENAIMTWPSYFTWDDCLAAQAQAAAEAIVAGQATHTGTRVAGQNGCCVDFYMDNLFESDFRISFDERPGEYGSGQWALYQGNGSARMGIHYADFGGDGPVIQMLGIGAAMDANCRVTWVLQFGE